MSFQGTRGGLSAVARALSGLAAVLLTALSAVASPAAGGTGLLERIAAATPLRVEALGTPVSTIRSHALFRAPNPDGKTWDILKIYCPNVHANRKTIVVVDTATDQVKQFYFDEYLVFQDGAWAIAPDGRLFMGATGLRRDTAATNVWGQILLYDPATNALTPNAVSTPPTIAGETLRLLLGPDGMLYFTGSHPSGAATAIQVNPETLAVTDYGPIGPSHAPDVCLCRWAGVDHRYICLASGKIPWYLVAFDRQTRTWKVLAETRGAGGGMYVGQQRKGCFARVTDMLSADGRVLSGSAYFWLYDGKAVPDQFSGGARGQVLPWDAEDPMAVSSVARAREWNSWGRKDTKTPSPDAEFTDMWADPDSQGNAEIWYRTPEARDKAPASPPADARPQDLGWKVYRYRVPLEAQTIHRLTEMPDGRLLGSAGAYTGNFVFDPKTGQCTHLGSLRALSHYATAFHQGRVYMSGYPSSPLCVYDPSQPWTADRPPPVTWQFLAGTGAVERAQTNPRVLLHMNKKDCAGTHTMYAAAVGADGRIYFGGRWARDGECGGVAWWDPGTEQVGGFWEILSNYQVSHMTTSEDRRLVVVSTLAVRDPVLGKPMPKQGKLFIYDTSQHQVVREIEPVAEASGTGPIACVGGTRVLGWTCTDGQCAEGKSTLYLVDVATGEVTVRREMPFHLPAPTGSNQKEPFDFRLGPDGCVWTFMGKGESQALVRITPDAEILPVGRIADGGCLAFAGDDVYLGGSTRLRKLPGAARLGARSAAPLKER